MIGSRRRRPGRTQGRSAIPRNSLRRNTMSASSPGSPPRGLHAQVRWRANCPMRNVASGVHASGARCDPELKRPLIVVIDVCPPDAVATKRHCNFPRPVRAPPSGIKFPCEQIERRRRRPPCPSAREEGHSCRPNSTPRRRGTLGCKSCMRPLRPGGAAARRRARAQPRRLNRRRCKVRRIAPAVPCAAHPIVDAR